MVEESEGHEECLVVSQTPSDTGSAEPVTCAPDEDDLELDDCPSETEEIPYQRTLELDELYADEFFETNLTQYLQDVQATQLPPTPAPQNPSPQSACVGAAVANVTTPTLPQSEATTITQHQNVSQAVSSDPQHHAQSSCPPGATAHSAPKRRGRPPGSGRGRGRGQSATPAQASSASTAAPGASQGSAPPKLTAKERTALAEAEWDEVPYDPNTGAKTGATVPEFEQDLPRARSETHCNVGGPSKFVYEKVSAESRPIEFLDLFLTPKIKHTLRKNSNLYATGVKEAGANTYLGFNSFDDEDIEALFTVLFMNGLHPMYDMEDWFVDPNSSPIYGDERVRRLFGSNCRRRWKEVRTMFHISDPFYQNKGEKRGKLGKLQELEQHMKTLCEKLWRTGYKGSLDEQTIGFSGRSALKIRIKCKAEGDGFQCDSYCEEGYTFTWEWRMEDHAPFFEGCSPLHTRCLMILSRVHNSNGVCFVDNLYTSKTFFQAALKLLPKPVLMVGVCRTGNRGFPKKIEQAAVTTVADLEAAKGTIKVAVHNSKNLVALSIYDEKPVHLLTTAFSDVIMVNKSRPVFNREAGEVQPLPFQKLNVIDAYNYGMNNVDRADQLRGSYRPDHFTRQRKWWWSIFNWLLGIAMTNSYILYKRVLQAGGKRPLSHRRYIESVVAELCARVHERRKIRQGRIMPPDSSNSNWQTGKRKRSSTGSSGSAGKSGTTSQSSRAPKLTLNLLDSCGRLNRDLNHFLVPIIGSDDVRKRCQYCKHLRRKQVTAKATCSNCKISLCLECWSPFHGVEQL